MAFDDTTYKSPMASSKKILYAVIGGMIITLVTSIIPNNTAIGASNTGYPFPWLSQPLFPIGSPPTIIWDALLLDVAVWVISTFLIIMVYQALKSR